MKFANSIYLGGLSVYAKDSDYQSSKKLGLRCPICGEAVFLVRKKKSDYFAHYSFQKAIDPLNCENRILSKQGKDKIEKILIKGKNQRLKIYNQHLWTIIKKNNNIDTKYFNSLKRCFVKSDIQEFKRLTKKNWRKNITIIKNQAGISFEENRGTLIEHRNKVIAEQPKRLKKPFKEVINYLENLKNPQVHLNICIEIFDYLTTKSSNQIWDKIIYIIALIQIKNPKNYECLLINYNVNKICGSLVSLFFDIRWCEILPDYMK